MKVLLLALLLIATVASQGFLSKLKNFDVNKEKENVENNIAVNAENKKSQIITNVLKNNVTNVEVNLNAAQASLHQSQPNLLGAEIDTNSKDEEIKNNISANAQNKNSDIITNVLKNNETNVSVNINAAQLEQLAAIAQLLNLNPSHRSLFEVDVEKDLEEVKNNVAFDASNYNADVITNILTNNATSVGVNINAAQVGQLAQLVDMIKQNPQLLQKFQQQSHRNLAQVDVSKQNESVNNNVAVNAENKAQEIITNVLKNNITSVDVTINAAQAGELAKLVDLFKQNPELINLFQQNSHRKLSEVDVSKKEEGINNGVSVDLQNKKSEIITNVLKNNVTSVDVNINIAQLSKLMDMVQREVDQIQVEDDSPVQQNLQGTGIDVKKQVDEIQKNISVESAKSDREVVITVLNNNVTNVEQTINASEVGQQIAK